MDSKYRKKTDLPVNVLVESTFDTKVVSLKINEESLGRINKAPFKWDAEIDEFM